MKATLEALDMGQLDMMWSFLRFGSQKPNISALKESCDHLRKLMIQKRRKDRGDVSFDDFGTIINCIVIEAMCLYLSGELDKLEEKGAWTTKTDGTNERLVKCNERSKHQIFI